jgi:hypothetical protein
MNQAKPEEKPRYFYGINLDWAIGEIEINDQCLTITAEARPFPGDEKRPGYLYRAHIKMNPNSNWEGDIAEDTHDWELAQRSTPLWETLRGDDYNYSHEPWSNRPNLSMLLTFLKDQKIDTVASRIKEAYQLN